MAGTITVLKIHDLWSRRWVTANCHSFIARACFVLILWPLADGADEARPRPHPDLLDRRAAHRARKPQKHRQTQLNLRLIHV